MSNLNTVVNDEIARNSELMKKRGAILEVGRIIQNRGGNNAATRTVRSLIAKLKSKHSRDFNLVISQAKSAAKLTRGGRRTRKHRKTRRN
jgi:hypothetical protein